MKKLFIIFMLIIFTSCLSTFELIKTDDAQVKHSKLIDSYVSCSGFGKIFSKGGLNGNLNFSFTSQNDSSFFQFNDLLGRKILVIWLTPGSINAWNILDNKRYDNTQIIDIFPLFKVMDSLFLTKFLWGSSEKFLVNNFSLQKSYANDLTVIFEKINDNLDYNFVDRAILKDEENNWIFHITLNSRIHSNENIDLSKLWEFSQI